MPHHGPLTLPRLAALAALALASQGAWAQAAAPAAGASGIAGADARAQREADKVFQWIRIHSDKPRKAAAAPAEKAPAPVRAATRPAKAQDSGVTEKAEPIAVKPSAQPPAPQPVAAAPAEPPPAPVAAAPAVQEDETLRPIHRTDPEFPPSVMRSLRKGAVQVRFTVQPDGSVAGAQVVSASHPRLGPSAVATVNQWRFQPVHHAQQAVVDLGFNLD